MEQLRQSLSQQLREEKEFIELWGTPETVIINRKAIIAICILDDVIDIYTEKCKYQVTPIPVPDLEFETVLDSLKDKVI